MSYETIAVRLPGAGAKRVCVSCAARFYDMARTPPVCPKCGAEQPPIAPRAAPIRRGAASRMRMMKAPLPVARDTDDDVAPVLDADDDDEAEPDEDAEEADVEEVEAEHPEL